MPPIPTSEKRPFIPAPGVLQVEAVYKCLGEFCENVYHVYNGTWAGALTPTIMQHIAQLVEAWESGTGRGYRHQQSVLDHIVVRDLSTQTGPAIERTPTTVVTGLRPATPAPNNVTVAVKWNTLLRGRSYRGRTFHIGMPMDFVTGDQITAAAHDLMIGGYDGLRTSLAESADQTMVVLSYAHNKFWRDTAVATPIVNCSVNLDLDSQRRRLAGRGT